MSGYSMAILGVADALTGASVDAAYEAAYGTYYRSQTQMLNAANAKVAAEANISAIKQDKINTDTVINMRQDEAEAQAKVLAAVSGTTGQSVDATIYQTEVNSSLAKSNASREMDRQIENQKASIYASQSTMLAVDDPQINETSSGMDLVKMATGVMSDSSFMGQLSEGVEGLFKTPSPVSGNMAVNYQPPSGDIFLS